MNPNTMDKISYVLGKVPYFIVRIFAICLLSFSIWLWLYAYGHKFWANIVIILTFIALILLFIFGIYSCYKEYQAKQCNDKKVGS